MYIDTVDLILSYSYSSKIPPLPPLIQRITISKTGWNFHRSRLFPTPGWSKLSPRDHANFVINDTYKWLTIGAYGYEIQHALVSLLVEIVDTMSEKEYALSYFNRQKRKLISFNHPTFDEAKDIPEEILYSPGLEILGVPGEILNLTWL